MTTTHKDDETDLSEFDLEYQTFLELAALEAEREADDATDESSLKGRPDQTPEEAP